MWNYFELRLTISLFRLMLIASIDRRRRREEAKESQSFDGSSNFEL